MDYFRNFTGSFENKVAQMMKFMKDSAATIPYGADELSDIQSKNQLLEHYDYTTARMKRRIQATVKYRDKANKLLADKMPQKEIDELFAHCNGLILRGGYNAVDHNRFITLAVAVWILDQLSLQGCLQKAFPHLREMDEDEILCPYVVHPQYDQELICCVVKLLLYRNCDSYGGLGKHESTLVTDSLQFGKLRSDFDAVMALLDRDAIAEAVKKYEDKVWEFYALTILAANLMDKAHERLQQELKSLQKAPASTNVPACMVRPNLMLLPQNDEMEKKAELLRRKLRRFETTGTFTELGLANSREKTARSFSDAIGKGLAKKLIDFSVDDPFEMAFALFYLLDTGSDIPWLFYGSICVAYTLIDQLPFDTKLAKIGEMELRPELTRSLYAHRFSGYRWDDSQDCRKEPVQRDRATNLAQLLYENAYALYPRVIGSLPQIDQYFVDMGLEDPGQKEAYQLLLYLLRSGNDRSESLHAFWWESQTATAEQDVAEGTEDISLLQKQYKELLQRNSELRIALHEEAHCRRNALKDICQMKADNECLRQELTDLRNLIFSQQAELPLETKESCTVQFPVKTTRRIVSFGGHPNWIRDMKALLPDVAYFSADVIPNKDILRNADVVWVQTQYISHAAFYRIVSALGQNTQLRYFSSKSARSCAEQVVNAENLFVKNKVSKR